MKNYQVIYKTYHFIPIIMPQKLFKKKKQIMQHEQTKMSI